MFIRTLQLFLLFLAITPNFGFYSDRSFVILSTVVLLSILNLFFFKNLPEKPSPATIPIIHGMFIFLFIYAWNVYGGYYQNHLDIIIGKKIYIILLIICLINIKHFTKQRVASVLLIGSFIILSLWTIYTSPNPRVDVFVILKEAPQKLLQGINPYSAIFSRVYPNITPNYVGYLPLPILLVTPFVIFFKDPRIALVVANCITAILLSKLSRNKKNNFILVFLFLFFPRSFFILEHAYLDPFIFLFFIAYIYLLHRKKSLSYLLLSTFLTIKQHMIIILPIILQFSYKFYILKYKNVLLFLLPITIILLFYAWDSSSFISETITMQLPAISIGAPVTDGLSLPIYLFRNRYVANINQSVIIGTLLFLIFACITYIRKIPFTTKAYLTLLFFTYFQYRGFFNHYFLVSLFLMFDILIYSSTITLSSLEKTV